MARAYTCGVPTEYCSGNSTHLNAMLSGSKPKAHNQPEAAFDCHAKYLMDVEGYTRLSSREFVPKDGGPIRVLTKKSRFGGELRGGKRGEGGAGGGGETASRYNPEKKKGNRSGIITST